MNEPRILKEEVGPNANIRALVEEDGRSVHLYLEGIPEDHPFGVRSCWVRNLRPAPALIEAERMQAGLAPMLPARNCVDPEAGRPLRSEDLEFLWFESGDGVALLEKGDVLAVIPPWSGKDGFAGYARDCALASPLCDPLGSPEHDHHGVFARLARAAAFWESWDHNPWPKIQEGLMRALEAALGPHTRYFSTSPERWPPRSLTLFEQEGRRVAVTGGMSLRPQPRATGPSRIELGLAWEPRAEDPTSLLSYLSGQALLPWERYLFLDEGHSIVFSGAGGEIGPEFQAVLLWERPPGAPDVALPPFEGEPVRLLWMVPITASELEFLRSQGADALKERLSAGGAGWIHRTRTPVV